MKFENTGIEGLTVDFHDLTELMRSHGFYLTTQWDWDRVTYEKKFEKKQDIYCLRIQGYTTEGDVGGRYATIKLVSPFLGKQFHLYDMDYSDEVVYPKALLDVCYKVLDEVKDDIEKVPTAS